MQNRPFLSRHDTTNRPCITDVIRFAESQGGIHGQPRPHAMGKRVITETRQESCKVGDSRRPLDVLEFRHLQRYRWVMERAENSTPDGRFDSVLVVTRKTPSSLAGD